MDAYNRKILEIQQYITERKSEGKLNALYILDKLKELEPIDPAVSISGGNNVINIGDITEEDDDDDHECHCEPIVGPPGPQGEKGEKGDTGDQGEKGEKGDSGVYVNNTILTGSTYNAQETDYYIGVNSDHPTTIYVSGDFTDGHELIIKIEMGPPIGNKKVTVISEDTYIDGQSQVVLQNPYECLRLIFRNSEWHVI